MFFSESHNEIPSRFANYGLALEKGGPHHLAWGPYVEGLGKGAIDHQTIAMVCIIDGGPRDSVGVF